MYHKIINIQQKLKAPKTQRNNFGNYNYRSCEDILEAVKPLLEENKCFLVITDEIINLGNRYYVKATAKLINDDGALIAENNGIAREEESKKGMDGSQITGASSSYARKYALNGLFGIDDTKDSDYTNTTVNEVKATFSQAKEIKTPTMDEVKQYLMDKQYTTFSANKFFNYYNNLGWKSKDGKPITDWQKLADVWNKKQLENDNKTYEKLATKGENNV